MKKYRFKLESVLRYRRSIEDQNRQKLAGIKLEDKTERNRLEDYQEAQEKGRTEFLHTRMNGITASQITLYTVYLGDLEEKILSQKSKLEEISTRMEAARRDLLEASKERKMLEKLREKKLQQYLRQLTRAEQSFLDEVSANQYFRASLDARL